MEAIENISHLSNKSLDMIQRPWGRRPVRDRIGANRTAANEDFLILVSAHASFFSHDRFRHLSSFTRIPRPCSSPQPSARLLAAAKATVTRFGFCDDHWHAKKRPDRTRRVLRPPPARRTTRPQGHRTGICSGAIQTLLHRDSLPQ